MSVFVATGQQDEIHDGILLTIMKKKCWIVSPGIKDKVNPLTCSYLISV